MVEEIKIVDARGLVCPLPVLRARKALRGIESGALLTVLATDRAAPADFEAFCREAGHGFVGIEEDGDVFRIRLRKGA